MVDIVVFACMDADGREIRNAVDTRRIAAEIHLSNSTAPSPEAASTKLILAAKRTHRRCPADGFNYYDGGWNVSDSHYLYVSHLSSESVFFSHKL